MQANQKYIVRITVWGIYYDSMPTTEHTAEQTAEQLRSEHPDLSVQVVEA